MSDKFTFSSAGQVHELELALARAGALHVRVEGLADTSSSSLQCVVVNLDQEPAKTRRRRIDGRAHTFKGLAEGRYDIRLWQDGQIVDTAPVTIVCGQATTVCLVAK